MRSHLMTFEKKQRRFFAALAHSVRHIYNYVTLFYALHS